jgi:purine-binding chemotaxis protein CheW
MIGASKNNADGIVWAPVNHGTVGEQRVLIFRSGTNPCAVPLDHVVEVMRALPIKPVAAGPSCVRGLCIVRGEAVAVIDPGLLTGSEATECRRLITIRTGRRTIALAAMEVLGIQGIAADDLKDLPPLLDEAGNEAIAAIGILDAELIFFLRAARVITPDVLDRIVADGAQP